MNIDKIKKINPKIIKSNGHIISFKEQLFDVYAGTYDTTYPLVVSPDSSILGFINGINTNFPIIFRPGKVFKVMQDHSMDISVLGNIEDELKNSAFAFDSRSEGHSKVVLLNKKDYEGSPIIVSINTDAKVGYISVNRMSSIYGKTEADNLITRTYEEDYYFYKNKNTEQYIVSNRLHLPTSLITALTDNNYKSPFNKSQVDAVMRKSQETREIKGVWLESKRAEGESEDQKKQL